MLVLPALLRARVTAICPLPRRLLAILLSKPLMHDPILILYSWIFIL
jgi:hypothetical protein